MASLKESLPVFKGRDKHGLDSADDALVMGWLVL